jgi:hypothetical protein
LVPGIGSAPPPPPAALAAPVYAQITKSIAAQIFKVVLRFAQRIGSNHNPPACSNGHATLCQTSVYDDVCGTVITSSSPRGIDVVKVALMLFHRAQFSIHGWFAQIGAAMLVLWLVPMSNPAIAEPEIGAAAPVLS